MYSKSYITSTEVLSRYRVKTGVEATRRFILVGWGYLRWDGHGQMAMEMATW